ncbi:MAG: DoxX family protein [Vulcanimicrobiaceae bacterium]
MLEIPRLGTRADIALLALRVVIGVAFVFHGYPKIQHPVTWLSGMAPSVPGWLAAVAAFAEFAGGIALVVGFATPLFAFLIACNMIVAIFVVLVPHGATFVGSTAGATTYELPLVYLIALGALILLGPGTYSLDGARGGSTMPRRRRRGR